MHEPVVMIAGVLKEAGIDNAQWNRPFLLGDVGIDVSGTDDMKNGEQEDADECWHGHLVSHHVSNERNKQQHSSCMLQRLFTWINGMDKGDGRKCHENHDKYEFGLVHKEKNN